MPLSLYFPDDQLFAFDRGGQAAERFGGRTLDVDPVLVVPAVMTGAKEPLFVGLIGDVAVEMGADADEREVTAVLLEF
jgi:hypothetical protein